MAEHRTHTEIEELLGAYALDAVEPDEAAEVDEHLAGCARCRAEVAEHREVAALLAHGGQPAPEGVWDRIAGAIEGGGPGGHEAPPPLFRAPAPPRHRTWTARALAPVAAVAAAVIGVLGFQVVDQGNELAEQDERITQLASEDVMNRAFQEAMADPEARLVELTSTDGERQVRAVVTGTTAYLHAAALPELPPTRTYQLWGGNGDQLISLGVLGARPDVTAFQMADGVVVLAITEEPASGVVVSDAPPVVAGAIPEDA